ncbi:MAG TPA: hypothetical protein VF103_11400, partial [Polyangiaceae bacterium]
MVPGSLDDRRPSIERLWSTLALVVPLVVTLLRAASSSDWRDDVPAVTSLGVLPLGTEGFLGLVGTQAASLLPLGGRWLRAAWVGAFAVALAGRLVYALARRLLDARTPMPQLAPPLALAAALIATLSPTFQAEGTVIGGAALATTASLAALVAHFALPARDARTGLVVGTLAALTAAESHAACLSLLVALGVSTIARRSAPEPRVLAAGLAGAGAVALLVTGALALRAVSPSSYLDLGFGLGQSSLSTLDPSTLRATAFSAWLSDVGPVALALSLGGAVFGSAARSTRRFVLPLLALALVDIGFPAHGVGTLTPDPSAPARLLALAGLSVVGALGVQSAASLLSNARLPFAKPAAVLLVVFDFTLVFVGVEASAAAAERRTGIANEVWTDEAFGSLPRGGLLLGRSEAVAFRLWAAQLVRGERPDAVIVPVTLLERGALRQRLLASEPALAPLLRDIALTDRPGEYALSTLADARPLFVELDQKWDEREDDHIVPGAFWLRFRAHPVGRSDRTVAFARAGRRIERAVQAVTPLDATRSDGELAGVDDASATRAVLVATLRQRALFLAARKDRDTALATADLLEKLDRNDAVAKD